MITADVMIRPMEQEDINEISHAFRRLGWNKPYAQYEWYLMEQAALLRDVYVAFIDGQFAGYVTICWTSQYRPFQQAHIPEIVDFNVLPEFRRRGIGTQLMDKVEAEIAKISSVAGIAVGLTPDYGAAQRLYIERGYVPDGRGLHYKDHHPVYGEQVIVNDELALYLTKVLK